MPPLGPRGKTRKVRRKPVPPSGPRDAIFATPKPKVKRPVVRSEIAAAGGVDTKRVKAFKKTATYKQSLGAAKPVRQSDVTSSGPDYGIQEAVQFRRGARQAVRQARKLKPFDPYHLQGAINLGYAPDVKQGGSGVFFVHKRRRLLPDTDVPLDPKRGILTPKHETPEQVKAINVKASSAGPQAPVLKVLEQTTRPLHGIAGGISAALEGKDVSHAIGQGFLHNKQYTFSRVLRDLGAPKIVRGPGGFVLDVFGDPTTYVSFGAASVAKKAAEDAAEKAAAKAAAAGMSEAGQATVAKQAAKRAAAAAKSGKGVTVRFAGKQAPGVTTATAAGGRVVKKVAGKAPKTVRRAAAGAREIVGEVRPTLAPLGADAESYLAARQGARSARASVHRHIAKSEAQARGFQEQIPEEHMAAVVDAVERNRLAPLAENYAEVKAARKTGKRVEPQGDLYHAAVKLRSANRYANRLRKRAGVAEGTITKRRKVVVPKVTADVETSRQKLNAAIRDLKTQERMHQESLAGFGVARGRAQILSRNVAGAEGEKRAQALTVPDSVNQFAGGGHGVRQAAGALQAGARNVAKARERVRNLQATHEGVVTEARQQRVAQRRAVKRQQERHGEATGYFAHAQQNPLLEGLGIVEREGEVPRTSGTVRRPGSSKQRTDRRPISEQNPERVAEGKDPYSTDIPLVHINYQRGTAQAVAAGELEKSIAASGRRLHPGRDHKLREGEAIYHLGYSGSKSPFMLREVSRGDWEAGDIPKHGQFVALDKRTVEAARTYGKPTQAASKAGRAFDKVTRGFKITATATPGFHLRNLAGDTQLGYLVQSGHRIPANMYAAFKATRGLNNQRRLAEQLAHDVTVNTKTQTVKVAGRDMPISEFLHLAEQHGIPQSGYLTRELVDLGADATKAGISHPGRLKGAAKATGRLISQNKVVKAITQDRENFIRLSTFKHGLDEGLPAAQAADLAMQAHIDYADLTELERKYGRRLFPFYTFSARALPFQVKRLVQRPGKFANIEKAREDAGGTDVSAYAEFTQRQLPFLIGGKAVTDALPATLLNEVPTGTNPKDYANEVGQYVAGMLNPIFRVPIEAYSGKSLTFRNEIQPKARPLVAAPSWVSHMPNSLKKALGVTSNYVDPRTEEKTWGWYGKSDYWARVFLIGPANIANQLATSGTNRIGQGARAKAMAGLTGVRVTPPDSDSAALNQVFTEINKLDTRRGKLNQQGIDAKHPTPEYQRIVDRQAELDLKRRDAEARVSGKPAPALPFDRRLLPLRRQERAILAGGGVDEYGFATKPLQQVRDKIRVLEAQKHAVVGAKPSRRIRPRPLTPREQIREETRRMRQKSTPRAIRKELQDEINRLREEAKVARGG